MNRIREFVINNKSKMIIASTVTLVLLIVVVVIVSILASGKEDKKSSTPKETSTKKDIETEKNSQTTTSTEVSETETTEIETTEERTTPEKTTEETSTEAYVPVEYPYLIKVNRAANCTTVYSLDANGQYTVPCKAITVSCGKYIEDTPLGQFNTIISYDWRLMFDGTYGHYAYRIIGSTLFHSVPYYTASNDNLEWMEYNKLGSPASLGCVRMTVADAKWLVENCPIGTTVIIYDDASNPGPLGKPDTIKIPEDSPYRGWDPTDPHPNNPWHQFSAKIESTSNGSITLEEGSRREDLLVYFKATDTCGNDITDKIEFVGNYNLNVSGTYIITAKVVDAIGRKAEMNVNVVINEKETVTTTQSQPETQPTTTQPTTQPTTTQPTTTQPTTQPTTTQPETDSSKEEESSLDETTSPQESTSDIESISEIETIEM